MNVPTRWRLRRFAALLIAIESVLLIAAISLGVIGLNQLSDARARVVDEIDPELLEAQNLQAALLNQETGLRGYLLSGQAAFRDPYDQGRAAQDAAVAELRRLGAVDGTPAGEDVDRVLFAVSAWQRTALATISAPTPVNQALIDLGKAQFDAVRVTLDQQQRNLSTARSVDRANLEQSANFLAIMLAVISALMILFFVLLALGFRRLLVRPILGLAGEVRATTADISRSISLGVGPRELDELAADVETMRRRLVTEVSEQRQAHEMLDRRTQELQRSNSDLEQFAYVASHDLQEPLRKVASFCQLIQNRYQDKLDERGEQYINFAVDGARRMQVLINDLLSFSRVGRNVGKFVDVDTGEAVKAAVANVAAVVEETGAEIVHSDMPVVRGEFSLITAAFQNLISNAIKFRGEEPPRIVVGAERTADDEWTFSVTDNGIGIEPEYAERIFVIFQRLHPRGEHPGTGIGLALTRKIVEFHGGRAWLDTGAPRTTFRFTLPSKAMEPVTAGGESLLLPEESDHSQ